MSAWFEKITVGDMLDRTTERFGAREAWCFGAQRQNFQALHASVEQAARGLMACGIQLEPGEALRLIASERVTK